MTTLPKSPTLLLALVLAPASLASQSPPDRQALEQFRTTLAAASSVSEVRSMGQPAGGASALLRIRQGLTLLRLGELTGDRKQLDEALMRFDQAELAENSWPYPWFGIGLTKQALHARDLLVKNSRTQEDGLSYFQGYTQAYTEALARDPEFSPAVNQLRKTILAQGEREQPAALMAPIRKIGMGRAGTAADGLILARYFRRRNQADSAMLALARYVQRGGDHSIAGLERARVLAAYGSSAAAEQSYLDGLGSWSAEGRQAYREDLAWIATADELRDFDHAADSELSDWIREFWHWRDVEETRRDGERLQEHLRRWAYVDSHFRVVAPERRTIFSRVWTPTAGPCSRGDFYATDDILGDSTVRPWDGRHRERLYDDRAYIYMRHGEPAQRVNGISGITDSEPQGDTSTVRDVQSVDLGRTIAADLLDERKDNARANESWLYWIKGERRVYHFEGSRILGSAGPTTLAVEPLEDPAWLESRGRLDPLYYRVAHSAGNSPLPFACLRLVQQVVRRAKADATIALRTDSYTLLFPTDLAPVVQMYAVGRPDQNEGRILVVFSIPGKNLETHPDSDAGGLVYSLVTRLGATDSVRRIARSLDTLRQFVAADTIRSGSHLTGYFELPVPEGMYRVASAFAQPGTRRGSTVVRNGLDLQRRTDGMYLSDLVLGREGGGLTWSYRDSAIPLNPLGAFPRNSAAEVFYEVSGLRAGRSYVTSMELAPLEKSTDDRETIRLRFTSIAETDLLQIRRSLGLSQLSKGQYRLTVEVAEEGGDRNVKREQVLTIIE